MDVLNAIKTTAVDVANHVATHGFSAQVLQFVEEKLKYVHDIGAGIITEAETVVAKVEAVPAKAEASADEVLTKVEDIVEEVEEKVGLPSRRKGKTQS